VLEEWILALAGSGWIYLGIFVFATVDGFFPPIPSESVVIAVAATAMVGDGPNLGLLVASAAAGAFTGDQIAYAIGSRVDVHRVRFLRGRRGRATLAWAEHALANRGSSFILAARYIPVGRVAVNMTAGALGYRRRRFVALTALAAVTWAVYGTAIGVGAGAWLHDHPVIAVVAGVVIGVVVGLLIDWVLRRWLQPGVPVLEQSILQDLAVTPDPADDPAADAGPAGPLRHETRVAARPDSRTARPVTSPQRSAHPG
jgi:membrane protein DedA with SNARE-associated domain